MLKLYDHPLSGNCYKVRLFLAFNDIAYEPIFIDVLGRANRTAAFARVNPLMQVPALTDGEDIIWDSHAILMHLASRYAPDWMPAINDIAFSHMMQWIALSINEIGNSLQPMRLYHLIGPSEAAHHMGVAEALFEVAGCVARCDRTLRALGSGLEGRNWLVGDRPSIADIACYPYVSLCHQGGVDVDAFPPVARWLGAFRALPGFVAMDGSLSA